MDLFATLKTKKYILAALITLVVVLSFAVRGSYSEDQIPEEITVTVHTDNWVGVETLSGPVQEMRISTYLGQERNPNDTITLVSSVQAPFTISADAYQLGVNTPFTGTIKIDTQTAGYLKFETSKALFASISTDARFVIDDAYETNFQNIMTIYRTDNYDSALFADHVVAGTNNEADWDFTIKVQSPNAAQGHIGDDGYAGVFGEIGDNAEIKLTFVDDAGEGTWIEGNGDLGIFAGAMGENAQLSVSFTPTADRVYVVKTKSGAAGGLVGRMENGSKLILRSSITSQFDVSVDNSINLDTPSGSAILRQQAMSPQMSPLSISPLKTVTPEQITVNQDILTGGALKDDTNNELQTGGALKGDTNNEPKAEEELNNEAVDEQKPEDEAPQPEAGQEETPEVQSEPGEVQNEPGEEGNVQAEQSETEENTQTEGGGTEGDAQTAPGEVQNEQGEPEENLVGVKSTGVFGLFRPMIVYALDEIEEEPAAEGGEEAPAAPAEAPAEEPGEEPGGEDNEGGEDAPAAPAEAPEEEPGEESGGESNEGGEEPQQDPEENLNGENEEEEEEDQDPEETSEGAIENPAPVEVTQEAISVSPEALDTSGASISALEMPKLQLMKAPMLLSVSQSYSDGYVGGLVGYADNAEIIFEEGVYVSVTGTLEGTSGTGGIFGYYKCEDVLVTNPGITVSAAAVQNAFTRLTVTPQITDGSCAGGVYGVLEDYGAVSSSITIEIPDENDVLTGGDYRVDSAISCGDVAVGGVIGKFSSNLLSNTLSIENTSIKVSSAALGSKTGGIIGHVDDSHAAYIRVSNIAVEGANMTGGIIGNLGNAGSFLDVEDDIYLKGNAYGGIIGNMNTGVLRLQGNTYLGSSFGSISTSEGGKGGQIVYNRGNGLVYALGSGTDSAWSLYRATDSARLGDIDDWGEVLRLNDSTLTESDLFNVDMDDHIIHVYGAADNIATLIDFAKTALNIQLNYGISSNKGALSFVNTTSNSAVILSNPISLAGDIDLTGTGLTGLTRDSYASNDTHGEFTSEFIGNNHTVTLAAGEAYGYDKNGTPLSVANNGNNGNGIIYNHRFSGLFAKVKNGANIHNLTLDGVINVLVQSDEKLDFHVGSVAAYSSGNLALTSVNVYTSFNTVVNEVNKDYAVGIGGAIGTVDNTSGTVNITGGRYAAVISDYRYISNSNTYTGGIIGRVKGGSKTINFTNIRLEGSYNSMTSPWRYYYGGMISYIASGSVKVNISNTTIGALTVTQTSSDSHGGLVGYSWNHVDTSINGLCVDGSSISVGSGASKDVCGLIAVATGHMAVTGSGISVNSASVSTAVSSSNFGFIVNKAASANNALFLEINGTYDVRNLAMSGTYSVFDEIAAYTHSGSGTSIVENGAAIISIETSGHALSAGNTYQNQSTYGKGSGKYNVKSRYYYNLTSLRAKVASGAQLTGGEKALLWSLTKYAHSSIQSYFNGGFENDFLYGDIDLTGLSYYPVSVSSGVAIGSASSPCAITLANQYFNDVIEVSGSDSFTRKTDGNNQHYLMQCGLLYNASALTVSDLTLQGNSGAVNSAGSGMLVFNELSNGNSTITRLVLSGAAINGANGSNYAPLLINKIGNNTTLIVSTLYTTAGSNNSASSLLGKAGNASASGINISFNDIRLDGRTTALSGNAGLNNAYHTSRSIFYRATLFDSIEINNTGDYQVVYNFTHAEDWEGSPLHKVTYGTEISSSNEFDPEEQYYYYGDSRCVHPTNSNYTTTPNNTFASGWNPYVYVTATEGAMSSYHEVSVNHTVTNITSGCGLYNHPYVISDAAELYSVEQVLRGTIADGFQIILPDELVNASPSTMDMWDANTENDRLFILRNAVFEYVSDSNITVSLNDVREFMAGAYYEIDNDITVSAKSKGLGSNSNTTELNQDAYIYPYAFRGVIVGNGSPTVTLNNQYAFIQSANGAVIKGINFMLDAAVSLNQTSLDTFKYSSDGCASYGMVISQIMGGDNIIDGVGIITSGASISLNKNTKNDYTRTIPVGGYVGVVVNGGLIFRNMEGVPHSGFTSGAISITGSDRYTQNKTITPGSSSNSDKWLYVNPIVGRVIAGYVFNESNTTYSAVSAVLDNSTNNYCIPDLYPGNPSKLIVTGTGIGALNVSIPDSQAFFVMSCIINSGTASAGLGNDATYGTLDNLPWIAYRDCMATHQAKYDYVGTSNNSDYLLVSGAAASLGDAFSGTAKVPYIIQKYTAADNDVYKARSICGTGSLIKTISLDNTTYVLPAAFRGIGSFYYNDDLLSPKFNAFNGHGATIDLSMQYNENYYATENYKAYGSNNDNSSGFGIFNDLYKSVSDYAISDFTVRGSIEYRVFSKKGVLTEHRYDKSNKDAANGNDLRSHSVMSVGTIAGKVSYGNVTITNVTLSGISVNGMRYTGGFIGYVRGKKNTNDNKHTITIRNCGTDDNPITVTSGWDVGGMIGGLSRYKADISNDDDRIYKINQLLILNEEGLKLDVLTSLADGTDNLYVGLAQGGLIGYVDASNSVSVRDVAIQGNAAKLSIGHKSTDGALTKDAAGGVAGVVVSSTITIDNYSHADISFNSGYVGGLLGCFYQKDDDNNNRKLLISNVTIDSDNKSEIAGSYVTGGFVGAINHKRSDRQLVVSLSAISIVNQVVLSDNNSGIAAGTVLGSYVSSSNANNFVYVNNYSVSGCAIRTNYSSESSNTGTGMLVGAINNGAKLYGSNILVNNTEIEHHNGKNAGIASGNTVKTLGLVLGNNASGSIVWLSGISIYGCETHDAVRLGGNNGGTSDDYIGSGSFVVFADYNGQSAGSNRNIEASTISGINHGNDVVLASPYVTLNGYANIGKANQLMTSDGFASSISDSAIYAIASSDERYAYSDTYRAIFATNGGIAANVSTFKTEIPAAADIAGFADFPVFILRETDKMKANDLVNSFINLLANTNVDYGVEAQNNGLNQYAYTVTLSRMHMTTSGAFELSSNPSDVSLKRGLYRINGNNWYGFYMETSLVDNSADRNSFTLIDIAYSDPSDTGNTAYHLYVPVIVEKILQFDFSARVLSGTKYLEDPYLSSEQTALINSGSPVTALIEYTYDRTGSEWLNALYGGENLTSLSFDKNVVLRLPEGAAISHLANDTKITLVDKQTGKAYYSTFGTAYDNATKSLVLSRFKLQDGVTSFAAPSISDILDATAERTNDTEGAFVACGRAAALIKIGNTYYRNYNADTDSAENKYAISIQDYPTESYYLTIYTDADDESIKNYSVSSLTNLPGDYPNDRDKVTEAGIIVGKVFSINNLTIETDGGDASHVMGVQDNNNVLTATVSAIVSVDYDSYKNFFGTLYHSFLLNMIKTGNGTEQMGIAGDPAISGYYWFDDDTAHKLAYGGGNAAMSDGYVQLSSGDIKSRLTDGDVRITANVNLTYEDDGRIAVQFPEKPRDLNNDTDTGTRVFVKSNIDTDASRVMYSSITERRNEKDIDISKRYFSAQRKAAIHYNAIDSLFYEDQGDLGSLGVNPHDMKFGNVQKIQTVGVIDFSNLDSPDYNCVKIWLWLKKKTNGVYPEQRESRIDDYMDYVEVIGANGNTDISGDTLVAVVPVDNNTPVSSESVYIDLGVKTGDEIEGLSGIQYANYRVFLRMELGKITNGEYETVLEVADPDNDYIVYTNAKLLPDFIRVN